MLLELHEQLTGMSRLSCGRKGVVEKEKFIKGFTLKRSAMAGKESRLGGVAWKYRAAWVDGG